MYYQQYFDSEDHIYKICNDYLGGMDFVFKYYYIGCPSWTWCYRHHMVPLISDLYNYMTKMEANDMKLNFSYEPSKPALPLAHIMNIIPRTSMDLLPIQLKEKLLANDSKLRHTYPINYELKPYDRAREYAWHAHIPSLNIEEIDIFMKNFDWDSISDEFKKRNSQG